jgi:hypothetical protein
MKTLSFAACCDALFVGALLACLRGCCMDREVHLDLEDREYVPSDPDETPIPDLVLVLEGDEARISYDTPQGRVVTTYDVVARDVQELE